MKVEVIRVRESVLPATEQPAWNVGEARLFERFKVRDAEGEHVGDDFMELSARNSV